MGAAGFQFDVLPSDAEEIHDPTMEPSRLTETNAEIKARPIADQHPDAVVTGADTLVFLDGEPLGKPADLREAKTMLSRFDN